MSIPIPINIVVGFALFGCISLLYFSYKFFIGFYYYYIRDNKKVIDFEEFKRKKSF